MSIDTQQPYQEQPEGLRKQVDYESSKVLTGLKREEPKHVAAGLPAVLSSMKYAWEEMGVSRGAVTLMMLNQKGGIDCTSCAWPDPDGKRQVAEFCENGARAIADEATLKRVTPAFFEKYSVQELSKQSDHWLNNQGRITQPMVLARGSNHYRPISWDDAFKLMAIELRKLKSPDEAVFYTSGRTSNEAAFLYQLFVRQFGTNNLPDCSNMCHESSSVALAETIGIGKGTVTLEDFSRTDVIFILGQNPGTNHPRMLTALEEAKRKGSTIISVNPLPETGLMRFSHPQEVSGMLGMSTKLTDLFLHIRINGDMALLKGIMKCWQQQEREQPGSVFDKAFIEQYTSGLDAMLSTLEATGWDEIEQESGLQRSQIEEAAAILGKADRVITCWCMGLTQHKHAVATLQDIVNMHLLRGQIGKPGAGLCPVRGHSNVQGDRTVGIWERPKPEFLDKLQSVFGFEPPREHGYDVVNAIKAMHAGKVGFFFAMGGNFLSATPDTKFTAEALQRTSLTVHVSTKLNRSHLVTGEQALILPCLGRTEIDRQASGEQFISTENSMGVIQRSQGKIEPTSPHLRSEVAIVAGLAQSYFGSRSSIDWAALAGDYDRIRNLIEQVVPGFDDYNQRVRKPGGFYLPNGPRDARRFDTKTKRAMFSANTLPHTLLPENELIMMTIRSHDQFNTTIYALDDRYRGIYNERRVVLMNSADIERLGFADGEVVDLLNHTDGIERVAERFIIVSYDIPAGCVATYFPEANVLVPIDSYADRSKTPTSKFVPVTLRKNAVAVAS
jgi:molybdopterin-dependent oxidoreductase alpha subunit